MKKNEIITYKSVKDFAKGMGLTDIEIALISEKKRIIKGLKKRRLKANLSQAELAKLIGTKQSSIARMESGQISQVSMDFLTKVALALNAPINIKPKAASESPRAA